MLLIEPADPPAITRYGPRTNAKSWPNKFQSRFLEAGLISYEDRGGDKELLGKEVIDACVQTFVGKPLIIKHGNGVKPATLEEKAVGYISRVWFEPNDAWYYCEGVLIDDQAKELVKPIEDGGQGWKVSCGYHITATDERGGEKNAIHYAREILGFEAEHLAIVETPRYEGATIRLNEKNANQGSVMFKFWRKASPTATAPAAADLPAAGKLSDLAGESEVEIDGAKVRLNDLVALHRENAKRKASAAQAEELAPETLLEVDGKSVSLADLVAGFRANEAKMCDDAKKNEKPPEDDEETKKKKEAAKRKNDDDEAKRKNEADEETRRNNDAKKGQESFHILASARANPPPPTPISQSFGTMAEGIARGKRLCSMKPFEAGKN